MPDFLEMLDNFRLPKSRKADLMVGVWVVTRGKLSAPPAPVPPKPSTGAVVQHSQALAPQPTIPLPPQVPPPALPTAVSPPVPLLSGTPSSGPQLSSLTSINQDALAAEVASLTPEQIQLMLRTLSGGAPAPGNALAPVSAPIGTTNPYIFPPPASPPQPLFHQQAPPRQPWAGSPPPFPPAFPTPPMGQSLPPNTTPYAAPPPNAVYGAAPTPFSHGVYDRPHSPDYHDYEAGNDREWRGGRGRGRGRGRGNAADFSRKSDSGWAARGGTRGRGERRNNWN